MYLTQKSVLRGILIALSASKKKLERAHTRSLTFESSKQKEANTPKRSRLQKIIKLRVETKQIAAKRAKQRIIKTRSWFFEKINKIDEFLARLTRGQRDCIQLTKSKMKGGI
jgi:hypothetical protein